MLQIYDGTALLGAIESPDEVPKHKILPLCLYLIEKDFHFTGDGIWGETAGATGTGGGVAVSHAD